MGRKCGANGRIRTVDLLFTKQGMIVLFCDDRYGIRTFCPPQLAQFVTAVTSCPSWC